MGSTAATAQFLRPIPPVPQTSGLACSAIPLHPAPRTTAARATPRGKLPSPAHKAGCASTIFPTLTTTTTPHAVLSWTTAHLHPADTRHRHADPNIRVLVAVEPGHHEHQLAAPSKCNLIHPCTTVFLPCFGFHRVRVSTAPKRRSNACMRCL